MTPCKIDGDSEDDSSDTSLGSLDPEDYEVINGTAAAATKGKEVERGVLEDLEAEEDLEADEDFEAEEDSDDEKTEYVEILQDDGQYKKFKLAVPEEATVESSVTKDDRFKINSSRGKARLAAVIKRAVSSSGIDAACLQILILF
jgi:hypothetical protein